MYCSICGREYDTEGTVWALCRCDRCREAATQKCIFCCFSAFPNDRNRPKAFMGSMPAQEFVCPACGNIRSIFEACACCDTSFLCRRCCGNFYRHPCCRENYIPIRTGTTPLRFAYPSKINYPDSLVGWASRSASEAILDHTASVKKFNIDLAGFDKNASRRFASVEIEILDYKTAETLNNVLQKWNCSVVHDGSILREYQGDRDTDLLKPFEINTSPACGNALYWQLEEIGNALKESKAEVAHSCGVHVHIDCRDFGYQEIQKLIKVYHAVEETLFAAVHPKRHSNEFCKPCGIEFYEYFIKGIKPDTKELKSKLISGLYGARATQQTRDERMRGGAVPYHRIRADHYGRVDGFTRNPMRYSALNLHSYFLRGTVETRIHHGSTDFMEIYNWAKILVDLFDSIYTIRYQKLKQILTPNKEAIQNVSSHLDIENSLRDDLDEAQVVGGLAILQQLLPKTSFDTLVDKIRLACNNDQIVDEDYLPCQLETN